MVTQKKSDQLNLRIGEKVQISLDDSSQVFPTLLEDIMEDGRLIISGPLYRGYPLAILPEQGVKIYYFRENGRYCIDCQAEKIFVHEELRLISLLVLSEPEKQQRRGSFRLPVNLDAFIRAMNEEDPPQLQAFLQSQDQMDWETAMTHNLSETGVSINSKSDYQIGDPVLIRLQLEDQNPKNRIELLGVVRRAEKIELTRLPYCRLGIEFTNYNESMRRRVAKFLLKKQQLVLQMKKNFDDN